MSAILGTRRSERDRSAVPVLRCHELPGPGPLTKDDVIGLAAGFAGRSTAECYFGPAMLTEGGSVVLVIIAKTSRVFTAIREAQDVGLLCWRWPDTPTAYVSFTLWLRGLSTPRPMPRWFGRTDDPLVQRIRYGGAVSFVIATEEGRVSPWFTGRFGHDAKEAAAVMQAVEEVFAFDTPGIPCTTVGERTIFNSPLPAERNFAREIRFAGNPTTDFWSTLNYHGPWWTDLGDADRARTVWGKHAERRLNDAARCVQIIAERRTIDGQPPLAADTTVKDPPPLVVAMIDAIVGPQPDVSRAYATTYAAIHDPPSALYVLGPLWNMVVESDDPALQHAFNSTLAAALLDGRITDCGRRRPWFRNTGDGGLALETLAVNLEAPHAALRALWEQATETINLLNAGLYCTPDMVPVSEAELLPQMGKVKLEGKTEDAEERIEALLWEAREARQWSIPWGARVAVAVRPFSSVRIYEIAREFICHFLDDQDNFFPVAVNLRQQPATYVCMPFLCIPEPGADPEWNYQGQLILVLIAAAIIRDFLVVEERDGVFASRAFRQRRHGRNSTSVIYLPRVRYNRPVAEHLPVDEQTLARVRHSVHYHLRKARGSSEQQRALAMQYGVRLPLGYTFVRPHERGGLPHVERTRIYRSRSASLMLFEAVDPGPNTRAPEWFKFERDCAEVLRQRGMTVVHHAANAKDGDGGMDLYCVDENGDKLVVQCKCWAFARTIGPEVVRELAGTMRLVDANSGSTSRGMIITTTRFSQGAQLAARELGIELVDGETFVQIRREGAS
jgi:hypothetical protein